MKKTIIFFLIVHLVSSCSVINPPRVSHDDSILIKKWVLSRCIGHATTDPETKEDAFNSASAYLEQSRLSVEEFSKYEAAIIESIRNSGTGSIEGTFKIKSCIEFLEQIQ
jgi:hypothetical protein